jgi:D-alanine-D-alanine ligase
MTDLSNIGNVAVLCGGDSREREISLQSGSAVTEGLLSAGVKAQMVDTADRDLDFSEYDRAFIALHGRDGEDGTVQSLLEYYDIPYTGSGVAASALSMNKWYTKAVWESVGVRTPGYRVVGGVLGKELNDINYPVYVKPVNEGSSIGISHVLEAASVNEAIEQALEYDDFVLIEQAIEGKEYTYSFIDGVAGLPMICLEPAADFYDYEAKYLREDTQYIVDPQLDEVVRKRCMDGSVIAYKSIGMTGWGRVDFMVDKNHEAWFIEVNSIPGMTSHSLVPMAAEAAGLNFSETCLAILEGSIHD